MKYLPSLLVFLLTFLQFSSLQAGGTPSMPEPLQKASKMIEEGLYKDALDLLQPWILNPETAEKEEPGVLCNAFTKVVECFDALGRQSEIDDFLEKTAELHAKNWRVLQEIGNIYAYELTSHGMVIDGKFQREGHGEGRWVDVTELDRIRALALFNKAMPLAVQDDAKGSVSCFFLRFAEALMSGREGGQAWLLQRATDLDEIPPYEEADDFDFPDSSAPVDPDGNPVLYRVPESFEAAKNDGERWRWCLEQVVENDPINLPETLRVRAEFAFSQFGETTLQSFSYFQRSDEDETQRRAGILSLETLADNEVVAKLATGIKRFELGPEDHYIALNRKILEVGNYGEKIAARTNLARYYQNRRQYTRTAQVYRNLIETYPDAEQIDGWKAVLAQIVGNWGRFEITGDELRGLDARLRYVFRNGEKVQFSAREIKAEALIADIKDYLRGKPDRIDWEKRQIERIGWQLLHGANDTPAETIRGKYLGEEVARWSLDLEPAEEHHDRTAMVDVPIRKPGAFLVKAEIQDGNTEYAVLWLTDRAIVRKPMDGALLYFVADAETGKPVAGAELDFFAYKQEWETIREANGRARRADKPTWTLEEFQAKTDESGFWTLEKNREKTARMDTLITLKNDEGRLSAWLGFEGVWLSRLSRNEYKDDKAFFISDRPVYRPGDEVEMKVWVGSVAYDQPNENPWAGRTVSYKILDPKGEEIVLGDSVDLDAYGGMVARYRLPKNATLGNYRFVLQYARARRAYHGGGTFRVEEYKKPEYEVSVEAPKEPVALGETVKATIKAKYYFGSPVTEATVKYTVKRETASESWYPGRPWDWFYGGGYWWFAYDYDWLPGWSRWGICRPLPSWHSNYQGPPEIVAEREVLIGEDGTVQVEIDTAAAKEMFPKDSQRYTITAEVVDNSRRTIVGSGKVLVAKEPFKVYAWVDRGYYSPSQKIEASFQSRRLDGKPVAGDAEVKVFKLAYGKDGDVSETEIHAAPVRFDEAGKARLSLSAAAAGQYRMACTLDAQEGGYVFSVYNNEPGPVVPDTPSQAWKFTDLELVPDKAEYASGDTVKLRVNTNRKDAHVLLFVKPENGVYAKPQVLHLGAGSAEVEIPVDVKDMPNFFVEAITVSRGKIVTETREIVVPPEQRILNVEVTPSSENYKPGEKAQAELKLTHLAGTPASKTQTVVAIYDKSVEYISGGSNVDDIKEFFWKWRRSHYPSTRSSLDRNVERYTPPDGTAMDILGRMAEEVRSWGGTPNVYFGGSMNGASNMRFSRAVPMQRGLLMEAAAPEAAPMMAKSNSGWTGEGGGGADFTEMMDLVEAVVTPDGGQAEPTVRQNFADTALWIGALETDENGCATIELDMPESLTTWKINVWALGAGTRVGHGTAEVITRKDLILRMQTPRFLVEKDQVVFSANVHNYLPNEKSVKVLLDLKSPTRSEAELGGNPEATLRCASGSLEHTVTISAGGETRVDWFVEAKTAGEATVTMKALTDEESDAMQKTLPVYVHGMLKQEAFSGYISPDKESASVEIRVPEERKPEQTKLTVRFSPTLAASMIDALPYLTDYPYGCTEQTLNRFLPTVIVQKILIDMNVDLEKLRDLKTNLNAQELSGDAVPGSLRRKGFLRAGDCVPGPVYDPDQVRDMVLDGVTKLTAMQCDDGGWGWFGGSGSRSSAHLTALVVHGLRLAQQNDVAVDDDVVQRGVEWLIGYQAKQAELLKNAALSEEEKKTKRWKAEADNVDAFVFMILASELKIDPSQSTPSEKNDTTAAISQVFREVLKGWIDPFVEMKEFLWRDRTKLSPYGVAMYGIAMSEIEEKTGRAATCVKMLEQYLVQDDENQTAYLNLARHSGWSWWYWHGSEFETQAYYLRLLMKVDPKSPVAPRLVKYLLNNRRHATYWNSTRDTAIVIEAFAEFIKATGEDKPDMTVDVLVGGEVKKTVKITPENLFEIDNTLLLEANAVATGTLRVELRKKGTGPLYFNAYLENFTLEDPIEKAGLEVKIERRFYKLERDESATAQAAGGRGQVVDMKVEKYKRVPVTEYASGDLVEVELVVESKNDYESIIIEDRKAAGLEPVDVRSGYTGNELGAYVEYRDERVAMFVYSLPRGKHSVTYRLRAEQPGRFSALPAKIEAMYAPELKGNSDETKIGVADK